MNARLDPEGEIRRIVLEETDGRAEVFGGTVREKSPTTFGHNELVRRLSRGLILQLPRDQFEVRTNAGHLRISDIDLFIPDVFAVPAAMVDALMAADPRQLEVYVEPLPFVVEVWSHEIDDDEIDHKISGYQARGDLEIWRIHPLFRPADHAGSGGDKRTDVMSSRSNGTARCTLHALPDVTIDVTDLFAA